MSSKVAKARAKPKSGPSRIRNQNSRIRNQISPVVLKLREILRADENGQKAAFTLVGIIQQSISNCQKFLSGSRPLNEPALQALIRSEFGDQIVAVVMGKGPHPEWYDEQSEDLQVLALSKDAAAVARRADEALQRRLGR
jgi:hypothetical protein